MRHSPGNAFHSPGIRCRLFDDGSVVTLDELCDEAGVPRLPYLEDLPEELEVDWEAKEF